MARYDTPGSGVIVGNDRRSGAHGLQWLDDESMWVAVPPARRLFLIDTRTMETKRSIPTPGARPHGIFVHDGSLWCADTTMKLIHKLDPDTGNILDQIEVPDPEVARPNPPQRRNMALLRHHPQGLHHTPTKLTRPNYRR